MIMNRPLTTSYFVIFLNVLNAENRQLESLPHTYLKQIPWLSQQPRKEDDFKKLSRTGKGNISAGFDDFIEEFIRNFEELRLTYCDDKKESWCQLMFDNIENAKAHRDLAVNVIREGVFHCGDQITNSLIRFLEKLLPFRNRPSKSGSWYECSEDNYRFLLYELFLYIVAIFISGRKYQELRDLFDHTFYTTEYLNDQRSESCSFTEFNNNTNSLDNECAVENDMKLHSRMADLIHKRADHKNIRFSDLVQADVSLLYYCKLRKIFIWMVAKNSYIY